MMNGKSALIKTIFIPICALAFCGFYSTNLVEVISQKINESSDAYDIKINIPEIRGLKDERFQGMVNARFKESGESFIEKAKSEADEYKIQADSLNIPFKKFEAIQDFNVNYNGEKLLSIPVTRYYYAGGAHGSTEITTVNIDKDLGREIGLKDLFKEGYDYKSVIDGVINERIKNNKDEYFPGTFKGINESTEFFLSKDGLVIYYQLYEIAPYVKGIPQFDIPYALLSEGLLYKLP